MTRMHPENVKVGMFIVLTGRRDEDETPITRFNPFGFMEDEPRRRRSLPGNPLKVLAINLPFICATPDGSSVVAIDTREWYFDKANSAYVRAMLTRPQAGRRKKGRSRLEEPHPLLKTPRQRKEKPDPRDCPYCGEKMVQQLRAGTSKWRYYCKNCDTDRGPAPIIIED